MKIKFVGGILIAVFLGLWIIGCGSDNLVLEQSESNSAMDSYKARQNEIARVNLTTLAEITENILASKTNLSEDELRARIFEKLVELKQTDEVSAGPYIPGYDYSLTWDEFWLLLANPWYVIPTDQASDNALAEAARQWPGMSSADTKADAFRHSYWNILLSKRINLNWAESFTTAHESETTNIYTKEMDLHNNLVGRYVHKNNTSKSEANLSSIVKSYWYKQLYLTYRDTNTSYLVYMK